MADELNKTTDDASTESSAESSQPAVVTEATPETDEALTENAAADVSDAEVDDEPVEPEKEDLLSFSFLFLPWILCRLTS